MSKTLQSSEIVQPDKCHWGLPGTGKTTQLMSVIQEEIQNGVPPEAIVGVTFRKSMAEEFKERAEEAIGEELDSSHWFRTTHSACFRLLDLDRDDVVGDAERAEVCDELGIDYSASVTVDEVISGGGGASSESNLGDSLFNMYSTMRNKCMDPMKHWREYNYNCDTSRLSPGGIERFIGTYEDYKRQKGLYDFEDMLEGVVEQGLTPPSRVLIEDEFQDKTPLQVRVYNHWADSAGKVYVSGDVYQSIYGFIGTTPEYMREATDVAKDSEILDRSYRFGSEIWDVARNTLTNAGYDVPDIEASGQSSVQRLSWSGYKNAVEHHREDDCLHLVRANYLASDVVDTLSEVGVPFTSLGGTSFRWTQKLIDLYNAIVEVANTAQQMKERFGYIQIDFEHLGELQRFVEAIPAGDLSMQKKEAKQKVEEAASIDDVRPEKWIDQGAIMEIGESSNPFERLNESAVKGKRERLSSAYDSLDGSRLGEINHRISTIHGAKGSEASSVFLLDGSTRTIQTECDPEEEARVWFVGATRAADNLYVVDCNRSFDYDIPVEGSE